MKKGDAVFANCLNPATGFIKRLGKDWADVQWNVGLGCSYVERARLESLITLTDKLNNLIRPLNPKPGGAR